jgi:hypothetical protein
MIYEAHRDISHTCGSTRVTQKFDPHAVSSSSPLIGDVLFAGRGVLSGVPFTLTSGTILVIVIALPPPVALLLALAADDLDWSDADVFGRSEEVVDLLGDGFAGPKVADDRDKEGVAEAGSGDNVPEFTVAFATAIAVQLLPKTLATGFYKCGSGNEAATPLIYNPEW